MGRKEAARVAVDWRFREREEGKPEAVEVPSRATLVGSSWDVVVEG